MSGVRRLAIPLALLVGCFDVSSKVGGGGSVVVSPDAVDFGAAGCEAKEANGAVTLVDGASTSIAWTATLGKGPGSGYRLPTPNGQVAAGAAVQIAVTATAGAAADAYEDTLTVTTDAAGDAPHVVQLHRGGAAPGFALSTNTLTFGKLPLAQASAPQPLTITNGGDAPAALTIATTNPAYAFNPASFTVAPKGSQVVNITYTPDAIGDAPATASFSGPDAGCAGSVALSGTGQLVAKKLALGRDHTCALAQGNRVACWGNNSWGQLGAATDQPSQSNAVLVKGVTDAIDVGAGRRHTCALTSGGQVLCWGYGGDGSLGAGALGDASTPAQVPGLANVSTLAVGWHSTCAGVKGGAVYCWGAAFTGSFNKHTRATVNAPAAVSGVNGADELIAGALHACARTGGTVTCWGDDMKSVTAGIGGITGATALGGGLFHMCALTGGTASCWGYNSYAQLGGGNTTAQTGPVAVQVLTGATVVSGGYGATCAVQSGQVFCWGSTNFLTEGNWPSGDNLVTTPAALPSISNATSVAVSRTHACIVSSGGAVKCWGRNGSGQLGDGTSKDSATPVDVLHSGP